MRLDRLTLRGLTTFQSTVDIDAAALPAGLIAVVGENGSGKTTLLEAMAAPIMDRRFISRGDGQLVDYAGTNRDAFIEATYTLDSGTYRARVNLDGLKRTTDALLEQIHPDGRRTSLSDGKATTFDAKVRTLFPSKTLLTSTVFAAQNRRGSFLTATKGQRKDLFLELLGVQHLEEKAATARAIATDLHTQRAAQRGLLERLISETDEAVRADLDARAQTLTIAMGQQEVDAVTLSESVTALTAALDAARTAHTAARDAAAALDGAVTDQAATVDAIARLRQRRTDADTARERALLAADNRLALSSQRRADETATIPQADALRRQHEAAVAVITGRVDETVAELEARVTKNQGLLDRGAAVREAAARLTTTESEIATGTAAVAAAATTLRDDQRALADLAVTLAGSAHLEVDLVNAREAAALLTQVPCGGSGKYQTCELLRIAIAARDQVPTLEVGVTERRSAAQRMTAQRASVTDADNALTIARADVASLHTRATALRIDAADLPFLEEAETRIRGYRDDQARARAAGDQQINERRDALHTAEADAARRTAALMQAQHDAETAWNAERDAAVADQAAAVAVVDPELVSAVAALATIDAQLATAASIRDAVTVAADAVVAAETNLQDVQTRRSDLAGDRARLVEQFAAHAREVTQLKAKMIERNTLTDVVRQLETDQIEWEVLAKALGRDGLPTLEMSAAGPVVSDLCNDLLEAALSSRRFTVELVTQEAKADGKGLKETFELKVSDSERGNEPRDVTDLSGGEQVLLDEALKAAIAVFLNQRHERPLRTCWRDETTGALDPENALRYVAMLRRLQELAGFHQIFMVSHNPTVVAMADAQLQIADGRVTVALPPFDGRAVTEAA